MARVRAYLTIDGVSGVSTDPAHLNSIELLAWAWDTPSKSWSAGGGTSAGRTTPTGLQFRTEDQHAALQLFRADNAETKLKAARLDIVSSEFGGSQYDFKGVTITQSHFGARSGGAIYSATLHFESLTPGPAGRPARSAGPEHIALIHEALYGRSRPGGK
jgi:type VI protein secretion system component Hcp